MLEILLFRLQNKEKNSELPNISAEKTPIFTQKPKKY